MPLAAVDLSQIFNLKSVLKIGRRVHVCLYSTEPVHGSCQDDHAGWVGSHPMCPSRLAFTQPGHLAKV